MERSFVEWLEANSGSRPGPRLSQIPGVLKTGDLRAVFQPLVEIRSKRIFAYEALVRSTAPNFRGPPSMFSEAVAARCVGALGRAIRELAIEGCPTFPLFLNIHPNEFDEGWLVQPDDPIFRHDNSVFLEITESVPLSHFAMCNSLLREIRGKGIYLAVDDLGAGYSNLKYISDLAPEIVKLDRCLIAKLPEDPRLQKLVRAIVRLCTDLGAKVVAEGLERREEVELVREAGVHYGQGYVFARPEFPPPPVDGSAFHPEM
jgi:EAL domain-containing protein (putative c-di-GMP-specific phosphodiesterase class I)